MNLVKLNKLNTQVFNVVFRVYSSTITQMRSDFENAKKKIKDMNFTKNYDYVRPESIFCNNEVNLDQIRCYGFDYDYTLAQYTENLDLYVFEEAKKLLVNQLKYHKYVMNLEFDRKYSIRGLHYDVRNGLFLKIDAYNNIQIDAVYRGHQNISQAEIMEIYSDIYIPQTLLSRPNLSNENLMSQLMDLFTIPEMNLIGSIIQLFTDLEIDFDPAYLYEDVSKSVRQIHKSGQLHQEIITNFEKYVKPNPEIDAMLRRLRENDKKLFVITNSDFTFVNEGMKYLTGNRNWTDYFDVMITSAKKPDFFTKQRKPFRRLHNGVPTWSHVRNFDKNATYKEGNLLDFMKYTGWNSKEIFYFGDHVYADLADVAAIQGWRTGCIIRELEEEIEVINSFQYQQILRSLLLLESLLIHHQHRLPPMLPQLIKSRKKYSKILKNKEDNTEEEVTALLRQWMRLREKLRKRSKNLFNPRFGSVFRTYHNPTYFSQRIQLYADLYTSNITNLNGYTLDHHFYPRRMSLPHEPFIGKEDVINYNLFDI